MAKLVPENHPALHSIAEEVTEADFNNGTVNKIVTDLKKAIKTYDVDGYAAVAIAAPQIGISKRISQHWQWGFLLAYNLAVVTRDRRNEFDIREQRSFVLSWLSLGFDLTFTF